MGLLLALLTLGTPSFIAPVAQPSPSTPEAVIRALVTAIYSNDVAAYQNLSVPDPRSRRLTANGRANEDALRELKEDPGALQIKSKRPFLYQGKPIKADAKGQYPVGTTALFLVAHRSPMMVTLVRRADGWKVDLRWWLAMTDLMSGAEPPHDSAEFAARALLASLIRLDRKTAAQFAAPGADSLAILFDGAPTSPEPSGQLDTTAQEMPLVELAPGEFFPTPSGRIVEGSKTPDVKVLLGQFGPVEIPFVVRRAGSAWRVDPEPYFMLILQ